MNRIASVLQEEGRLGAARQRYEEVRSMAPELGDRELEATAMNNIGVSWWLAGDLVAARRQLEGALVFFRRIGSKRGLSFTLFNLGFVLLDQGELDAATRAFEESAALSRELTQPSLAGMAVFGQGQVALARGDLAELLLGRGRLAEARREADRATSLASPTEFEPVQTAVAIASARVLARQDGVAAAASARAAQERAERSGHVVLALAARSRGFLRIGHRATSAAS